MASKKKTAKDVDLDKKEEGVIFLVAESGYKTACKVRTATYCHTLRAVKAILAEDDAYYQVWRLFEGTPGSEKIKSWEEDAIQPDEPEVRGSGSSGDEDEEGEDEDEEEDGL